MTARADITAAIRTHYLKLPGKTEAGWAAALDDAGKYNLAWRHMLVKECGQNWLVINRFPPPLDLRGMVPAESPPDRPTTDG